MYQDLIDDGREAPVIYWTERDYAESRLERYALAARYFDDLPNRPQERQNVAQTPQPQY